MQRINITPEEQGETTEDMVEEQNLPQDPVEEENMERSSESNNSIRINSREQTSNTRR